MKTIKFYIVALVALFASACVGFPPPSFARETNLNNLEYVEVPGLVGDVNVVAHFENCPGRPYSLIPCDESCGVHTFRFSNGRYNYQNTLRIPSNELMIDLDRAKRDGCFEYGVATNVTYQRQLVTQFKTETNYMTITETFTR
jgi:hypothetical protein